jgi:outer membrane protein assembly factor BamB
VCVRVSLETSRMRFTAQFSLVLAALACFSPAQAQKQHHFMFMQYSPRNALIEMSPDGKVLWEHPVPSLAVRFEVLKNGDVMYAYGGNPTGVQEVDRDHKVVWDYKADCEQVLGWERLPNGNVLVGEEGPCRAVEVNRKGEVVHTTPLTTDEKPAHRQLRCLHKLKNGNILACHEGDGVIREYTPDGKVVWEYRGVDSVFEAIRLKNGNTLVGGGKTTKVMEINPKGEIVWEFGSKDAPELGLHWITGVQMLKNGNLVCANFLQGVEGTGVHFFEVTRDKKVLWTWADHNRSKLTTMARFLDEPAEN